MSARRPWILPLAACALTALGVGWLTRETFGLTGQFVASPLDDAYIHLGLARDLAEHGTWGVNPGEHASASSSPLWTALLAAGISIFGFSEAAGLALSLLSGALLIGAAAATLRDEGHPERAVAAGLALLILAVPLPFLVALSMEHVLHAALALLLVRAATGEAARPGRVLLLSAAAAMTRYESGFLAGALAIVLARERPRIALASALGAALAITGFGLYSLGQGAMFLPNSVMLKAVAGRVWGESLGAGIAEGAPLLLIAVAASLGARALDTGALHRRRAAIFALTVLGQLLLGRMGWLYRYEGWLIAWGCLLLVAPARALLPRGGLALAPLALLLAIPLGWRAGQAWSRFVPGARLHADVDLTLARWVADAWPDATVAAHDLGALAALTDATLVDVIGLGTDEIARARVEGRFGPAEADRLLSARGVALAITGRDWLGAEKPASFVEIASLWAPFPEGAGVFETVIWSVDPAARDRLEASLPALEARLSPRVRLARPGDQQISLDRVALSGAAVLREPDRLAFYTNGEARLVAPITGELALTLAGAAAEGRGPRVQLQVEDRVREVLVGEAPERLRLGRVRAGESLLLRYEDDAMDSAGGDRNLFVLAIEIRP